MARFDLWRERIAKRGWRWLFRRLWEKFSDPADSLGRYFHPVVVVLGTAASLPRQLMPECLGRVRSRHPDTLFLFYDLQVEPVTYNVVDAMVGAELRRRELGLADIYVVIVPGLKNGLRWEDADYEARVDYDARIWRLHNIVIPVLSLLPSCRGYSFCSSRAQAQQISERQALHVHPEGYSVSVPFASRRRLVMDRARVGGAVFPLIKSPVEAERMIRSRLEPFVQRRRPVVITLREYNFSPERNSQLSAWVEFAHTLDPKRYAVIFVPDTAALAGPEKAVLSDFMVLYDVALNVQLRMALYEYAWLNMAVVHGPTELCWYSERCRYLLFMMVDTAPQTSIALLEADGFEVGGQLPWAKPWQRWVWEPDDASVLKTRFAEMERILA